MSNAAGYDVDFYAWTIEQAGLLRAGRLSEADIENIAEEIESMAQPAFRANSWRLTIVEQRRRLAEHLKENPSLRGVLAETVATAYGFALLGAQKETGLPESAFPALSPWTGEQVLAEGFLPEA